MAPVPSGHSNSPVSVGRCPCGVVFMQLSVCVASNSIRAPPFLAEVGPSSPLSRVCILPKGRLSADDEDICTPMFPPSQGQLDPDQLIFLRVLRRYFRLVFWTHQTFLTAFFSGCGSLWTGKLQSRGRTPGKQTFSTQRSLLPSCEICSYSHVGRKGTIVLRCLLFHCED